MWNKERYGDQLFRPVDRSPGEEQLVRSRCFLRYSLHLCCGVPRSALSEVGSPSPPWNVRCAERYIDYLVCWGDDVIMGIELTGTRDEWLGPPDRVEGLFIEEVDAARFAAGDTAQIERRIQAILREPFETRWKCPLASAAECCTYPSLVDRRLVERQENRTRRDRSFDFVPTPYGTAAGLIRVCFQKEDELLHIPALPELGPTYPRVLALLDGGVKRRARRRYVPLDERLASVHAGLPSDDADCEAPVRQMAVMPLRVGFAGVAESLFRLEHEYRLQCFSETYCGLAMQIYRRTHEDAPDRCPNILCALDLLSEMILQQCESRESQATAEPKPLSLRLAEAAAGDSAQPAADAFGKLSIAAYFHGMALCTQDPYYEWLGEAICRMLHADGSRSVEFLLHFAHDLSVSGDMENELFGSELLYCLLIEPFTLETLIKSSEGGQKP